MKLIKLMKFLTGWGATKRCPYCGGKMYKIGDIFKCRDCGGTV